MFYTTASNVHMVFCSMDDYSAISQYMTSGTLPNS